MGERYRGPCNDRRTEGAHMEQATCKCIAEVCGHANGEPCGRPVEKPVGYARDEDGQERPVGLCEECWKRVMPLEGK
jgi:hypothetical protein